MTTAIDDAIRIARRAAEHGTTDPGDKAVREVFRALAGMPDPDTSGAPIREDWRWESDGDGKPVKRHDQYIVADGELERIATFEGPDAGKNARAASCTPLLIATLKVAERGLSHCLEMVVSGVAEDALSQIAAALKETRYRKSR